MSVKIRKFDTPVQTEVAARAELPPSEKASNAKVNRFIAAGDSRPVSKKSTQALFRFPHEINAIVDAEVDALGFNRTSIVKAGILALHNMTEGEKLHWLHQAHKI